jgi:predicted nucleic acid-binding protein
LILKLYFFDSSALIKLFVQESGSEAMSQLFETTEDRAHLVSALAELEIHCTLRRLARSKNISDDHCTSAMAAVAAEQKRMIEYPLTAAVMQEAVIVSDRSALRALDALQLATALEARSSVFDQDVITLVSSDQELLTAAKSEGFEVWDPQNV